MTDKEFAEIFIPAAELFGISVSKGSMELWYGALQEYSIQDIRKAFTVLARRHKFKGSVLPAHIVEVLDGDPNMQAAVAWSQAMAAIHHIGSWDSVKFEDPAIPSAIEIMGGWLELCQLSEEELRFQAHHFKRIYNRIRNEVKSAPHLTGQLELDHEKSEDPDLPPPPIFKVRYLNGSIAIEDPRLKATYMIGGRVDAFPALEEGNAELVRTPEETTPLG